ncbi:hypothetical protein [Phenylobacterium sp.]|uniref:hypothetical protein n=1 Tax=Phenylobacterium sp. TaxID=1871053 RepID=UPI0035B20EA5
MARIPKKIADVSDLLVGYQKAEYARSGSMRTRAMCAQVALAIVSAITAFPLPDVVSTLLAVVATLVALALGWATWEGRKSRSCAERLRRTILLLNGLGAPLSESELRDITSVCSATRSEADALRDPAYFKSKAPLGARRLAENLAESAFWTRTLAGYASKDAWALFVGGVTFGLVVLAATLIIQPTIATLGLRVVTVLLVLLLSADFCGVARAYASAASEIEVIAERLNAELRREPDLLAVVRILTDYNAAVEGMPQFSAKLYDRHRDELNQLHGMWLTGRQP